MDTNKLSKLDEKLITNKFIKIKKGDILSFKVTELTNEYCLSELVDSQLIKGKVVYSEMSTFGIDGSEWFDVGDIFEGRVVRKDIKRTLIITPIHNLVEKKRTNKQQKSLERWLNGGEQ